MLRADILIDPVPQRRKFTVYKEFAIEAVVWLIPVAVLLGLAWMITATA
jgi:hypothetical protein